MSLSQLFNRAFQTMFRTKKENTASEEITSHNGSKLKDVFIPDEVLELILCHVETQSLLRCRLVCKKWNVMISDQVMRTKASRAGLCRGMSAETKLKIPWSTWYLFLNSGSIFGSNLIRNANGEEGLKHWKILQNGGDGWIVEKTPSGIAADVPPSPPCDVYLPNYHDKKNKKGNKEVKASTTCFVSSYGPCEKAQIIHLADIPLMENILDTMKPALVYREWFCRRADCGGVYRLKIALMDKYEKVLEERVHMRSVTDDFNWLRVENKFENYPEGVRYVSFSHHGVDNQFWKGHYGPKISGACLTLLPLGVVHEIPEENNVPIAIGNEDPDEFHLLQPRHNHNLQIILRPGVRRGRDQPVDEEEEEIEERDEGNLEADLNWDGIPADLVPQFQPLPSAEAEEQGDRRGDMGRGGGSDVE